MKNILLLSGLLLVLSACQTFSIRDAGQYLILYQDFPPKTEKFQVCHDVGCENLTPVSLKAEHWQSLAEIFRQAAASPAQERRQIASAVARFEKLVGPYAGTMNDQRRNQGAMRPDAQLDCIAETVNTTTYLTLFKEQGWLRWHQVSLPRHRGLFTLQAPHNTAVLLEKGSGKEYVVDTWFHANGEPPEIVPVEVWLAGYDPDRKK